MLRKDAKRSPYEIGGWFEVRGEIRCREDVVVTGRVEGAVEAAEHEVLVEGEVDGDVRARSVIIAGRVSGDVFATARVELRPGCQVEGEVHAPRLALHEGAEFSGAVQMGARIEPEPPAPEPRRLFLVRSR